MIVILGYTGLIGDSIFENLAKNTSLDLICVGRSTKRRPYINSRIKYQKWDFISFKKSNLIFLNKANIIINCVGKTDNYFGNLNDINVIFLDKLLNHINKKKLRVRLIHLSSIAVYGNGKNFLGQNKIIYENSLTMEDDLYSKSKLQADLLIKNVIKKKLNKNFSYTILRISNVFSEREKSNLLKFVIFTLKSGFWIKSSNDIIFNFVNVKDVVQAIILVLLNSKVSRNKTYIISDDCKQHKFYQTYQSYYKKKIKKIHIPFSIVKILINFFPLPKKLLNFFLIISSKVSYSNKKIKHDLNFNPSFSLLKKIKKII